MTGHALVIGCAGSLGSAIVVRFRELGWRVTGAGRTAPPPDLVSRFEAIAEPGDWPRVVASVDSAEDPLRVIVYAAGAGVFGETRQIPESAAREVFDQNFWRLSAAARAALDLFTARGGGCFVAVLSIAALRAVPEESFYAASKAAAARYLDCLRFEVPPSVRIESVYPGMISTPFRERSAWYGRTPAEPVYSTSPQGVAKAVVAVALGKRRSFVIGWRERAIVWADRLLPHAYDALLLRRRRGSAGLRSRQGLPPEKPL